MNTPRPRIPSSVAMPPPPNPVPPASSQHPPNGNPDRPPSSLDLVTSAQSLQSRINQLIGGDPSTDESPSLSSSHSPTLPAGVIDANEDFSILNATLESLQKENNSLQETITCLRADVEKQNAVERERDAALSSLAEMEKEARALERRLNEKDSRSEALERAHSQTTAELERSRIEGEARLNDLLAKLETSEALVKNLKEAIEVKEGAEHESDALLKAKNAEIGLLEGRLEKVSTELDIERKELGAQIEELRQAGQVSIGTLS